MVKFFLLSFCFVSLTICAQTTLSEVKVVEAISEVELNSLQDGALLPTPIYNELVIEAIEGEEFKISVFNSFGEKELFFENLSGELRINVSNLTSGAYYMFLKGNQIMVILI